MSAIVSEFGLLLLDMRGLCRAFKSSATKKREPVLRCTILNPDGNEQLSSLSIQSVSEYLFPLTDTHFDRNLEDQREKAMEPSFIKFKHSPVERVKHITLYGKKFRGLRQAYLWERSTIANTQANKHHITVWCVLLLFHVNIWMLAMTRKDTSLLVEEFDTIFQAHYADRLRHEAPPKVPFHLALMMLEYRHDKCKVRGTCNLYCPTCGCGVCLAKPSGSSTSDESPATKQFYNGFRTWKKGIKEGGDKSLNKYLSLHPNVKKPEESVSRTSSSAVSVGPSTGVEAYVSQQHRIPLHDSFEL
jgi:hypothetical protein